MMSYSQKIWVIEYKRSTHILILIFFVMIFVISIFAYLTLLLTVKVSVFITKEDDVILTLRNILAAKKIIYS